MANYRSTTDQILSMLPAQHVALGIKPSIADSSLSGLIAQAAAQTSMQGPLSFMAQALGGTSSASLMAKTIAGTSMSSLLSQAIADTKIDLGITANGFTATGSLLAQVANYRSTTDQILSMLPAQHVALGIKPSIADSSLSGLIAQAAAQTSMQGPLSFMAQALGGTSSASLMAKTIAGTSMSSLLSQAIADTKIDLGITANGFTATGSLLAQVANYRSTTDQIPSRFPPESLTVAESAEVLRAAGSLLGASVADTVANQSDSIAFAAAAVLARASSAIDDRLRVVRPRTAARYVAITLLAELAMVIYLGDPQLFEALDGFFGVVLGPLSAWLFLKGKNN
ncbi:hypothetical protein [Amycolatopsis methanolica]|uniref:hypothetical protein n=1 Tax=Amycolatopsis methanolica TaxID=1814 RepID=UPI00036A7022|nr:hypothetical protein [Amycolatopsis methanolica]